VPIEADNRAAGLDGERKTVTAFFADIRGSTELMENLDPEEARTLIDPALKIMMEAVHHYDGHLVQSTGDGVFALFGAPVACEDHPQRALYAALRLQEAIRKYAAKLVADGGTPLEARVGINTGEVVIRTLSTADGHSEYTPIGHTANLASRMQAIAPTGSIAITEHTRRLVEGYFQLKSRGPTPVKGLAEPINVYEVTGLGPLRTRFQRAAAGGLTKFVGRQREMDALRHALEQAKARHGRIVAAIAEPGVGKSRLFYEFKATSQSGCMVLEAFSVSHGKATAYLPVIDLLHGYFQITSDDDGRKRREKVGGRVLMLDRGLEDALPYLFSLLGVADDPDPIGRMDGQVKKRRTLDAIKRVLLRESLNQPLIVIFEDLHWIDGETQALLNLLADGIANAHILLMVSYRPEYQHEWGNRSHYVQLRLDPLGSQNAAEMLSGLLGEDPGLGQIKRTIIERTEGNPFFIEELVQALFDEGVLVRNGRVKVGRPVSQVRLPPTAQAVLAARIDRLPAEQKELLQTLAVVGREFPLGLIRRVVQLSEVELDRMLGNLQLVEFIYEQPAFPEAEYAFKHALTQEVAYNSVLTERRKLLHERTAAAIESIYADRLDDHLSELARHFRRSDNAFKAVQYLRLAGEQAARRSSAREAIAYLREALDRIKLLPAENERDRIELAVQFALGSALSAESWGAPEKMRAFERVSELAARLGADAEVFPALWHLAEASLVQEKFARAHELAQQSLRVAEAANDRRLLLGGHYVVGEVALWSGNLRAARSHMMAARELYDRAIDQDLALYYGMDPFSMCCLVLAFAECPMGRCNLALKLCRDAQARATEVSHIFSSAFSLNAVMTVHHMCREVEQAEAAAAELVTICREHGFSELLGWGYWAIGWAMLERHRVGEGLQMMVEAMNLHESIGGTIASPWRLGVLAEGYAKNSRLDDAQKELKRAIDAADQTGGHFFDAELSRIGGDIALRSDPRDQRAGERNFRKAIAIAKQQEARLWELRATVSLARLLCDTNRRDEARSVLAEIYNWFIEGFDLPDLKEARTLLDELNR
jgi:predicted ATPase/class 3 adenylate cyclase